MSRRVHALLAVLLLGIFAHFFFASKEEDVSAKTGPFNDQLATARVEASALSDWAANQEQSRRQVEALSKLESRQALRARAEARHGEEIPLLQARAAAAWTALLNSNREGFSLLIHQASVSPVHAAHCTLCDGTGMLNTCVLCGHTGKCVRCEGSGFLLGEYCPACIGTGKCRFCFGTGKMPCPFCDDGAIEAKTPFPPSLPSVH